MPVRCLLRGVYVFDRCRLLQFLRESVLVQRAVLRFLCVICPFQTVMRLGGVIIDRPNA